MNRRTNSLFISALAATFAMAGLAGCSNQATNKPTEGSTQATRQAPTEAKTPAASGAVANAGVSRDKAPAAVGELDSQTPGQSFYNETKPATKTTAARMAADTATNNAVRLTDEVQSLNDTLDSLGAPVVSNPSKPVLLPEILTQSNLIDVFVDTAPNGMAPITGNSADVKDTVEDTWTPGKKIQYGSQGDDPYTETIDSDPGQGAGLSGDSSDVKDTVEDSTIDRTEVLELARKKHAELIQKAADDLAAYMKSQAAADVAKQNFADLRDAASELRAVANDAKAVAERAHATVTSLEESASNLKKQIAELRTRLASAQEAAQGRDKAELIREAQAKYNAQKDKAAKAAKAVKDAEALAAKANDTARASVEVASKAQQKYQTAKVELDVMKQNQAKSGFDWKNASSKDKARVVSALIMKMTNDYRVEAGLKPLPATEAFMEDAADYSKVLSDTGKFDHDLPQPNTKARESSNFENIYQAHASAESINSPEAAAALALRMFNGWYDSAGHRSNIEGHLFTNGKNMNKHLGFMTVGLDFSDKGKAHGTMRLYMKSAHKNADDAANLISFTIPEAVVSKDIIADLEAKRRHYTGEWFKTATYESDLHEYDPNSRVEGKVGNYEGSSDPADIDETVKHADVIQGKFTDGVSAEDVKAKETQVSELKENADKLQADADRDAAAEKDAAQDVDARRAEAEHEFAVEAELKDAVTKAEQAPDTVAEAKEAVNELNKQIADAESQATELNESVEREHAAAVEKDNVAKKAEAEATAKEDARDAKAKEVETAEAEAAELKTVADESADAVKAHEPLVDAIEKAARP